MGAQKVTKGPPLLLRVAGISAVPPPVSSFPEGEGGKRFGEKKILGKF